MMAPDSIHQLLDAYYDALNAGNWRALAMITTPDFILESSGRSLDLIAFQNMRAAYREGFPDLHHDIFQIIYDFPLIAVVVETSGTHAGPFLGHLPSSRRFRARGVDVVEVIGGRIGRISAVFDTLGMLFQLGLYAEAAK